MSLIKSIGNKKVNFDFNKDFINIFSDKIKNSDIQRLNDEKDHWNFTVSITSENNF